MKCSCGAKSVVKLEHGETLSQFLVRRKCSNCRQKGNWRVLTKDEAKFDWYTEPTHLHEWIWYNNRDRRYRYY